jgi:hypothetical protein
MGSQGNYPGSGKINQHKHLAMTGDTERQGTRNMDSHLHEGGEYGTVGTSLEPVHKNEKSAHRDGSVRGNAP